MQQGVVTEIEAIAAKAVKPHVQLIRRDAIEDGIALVTHPAGVVLTDVTDKMLALEETPRARKGAVKITAIDSLINFVNRWKQPNSVLFADKDAPKITCAFDYHDPTQIPVDAVETAGVGALGRTSPTGAIGYDDIAAPRWNRFKAVFAFPKAKQYVTWSEANKKPMGQEAFAVFLEENLLDIQDPGDISDTDPLKLNAATLKLRLAGPKEMLEVSRGLHVTSTEVVRAAVSLSTGEVQIGFDTQHQVDGAPASLAVPNAFIIGVPVFEGGVGFRLLVRLRYRKHENKIVWHFDIFQLAKALEVAFTEECERVAEGVDLPLFYATEA